MFKILQFFTLFAENFGKISLVATSNSEIPIRLGRLEFLQFFFNKLSYQKNEQANKIELQPTKVP